MLRALASALIPGFLSTNTSAEQFTAPSIQLQSDAHDLMRILKGKQ